MNRTLFLLLACLSVAGGDLRADDPASAGQALAAELRSLEPARDFTVEGVLEQRDRTGQRVRQPMRMVTLLKGDGTWVTVYEVLAPQGTLRERLTVQRRSDQPNEYAWEKQDVGLAAEPRALKGDAAFVPLAGTDFLLADLGMEFLHWPEHRLLPVKNAMRKGRSCRVLESHAAAGSRAPYVRVVSWIDRETGGLMLADAYDASNRVIKRFSIGSLTKVQGRWELKNMEIRNTTDDTRTSLEFRYDDR